MLADAEEDATEDFAEDVAEDLVEEDADELAFEDDCEADFEASFEELEVAFEDDSVTFEVVVSDSSSSTASNEPDSIISSSGAVAAAHIPREISAQNSTVIKAIHFMKGLYHFSLFFKSLVITGKVSAAARKNRILCNPNGVDKKANKNKKAAKV